MNGATQQRLSDAAADLRAQLDRIREAGATLSAASHPAVSADRSIEATVDAQGRLTGLALRGTGYRTLAPAEIADRIVRTVQAAQQAAASHVYATLADRLPPQLRPVLTGTVDLGAMFDAAVAAGEGPLFADELAGDRGGREQP